MWRPKGRKSGSDEERIRAPFVGFDRCFLGPCLVLFLFSFFLFLLSVGGGFLPFGRVSGREGGIGCGQGGGGGGGTREKRGGRERGGEGRIRWGDGLVLDAFGLFLFLLVCEDREGRFHDFFFWFFQNFFLGEPSFRHSIWTSFIVSADKDVGRTDSTVPS